jgi:hypothetical protein
MRCGSSFVFNLWAGIFLLYIGYTIYFYASPEIKVASVGGLVVWASVGVTSDNKQDKGNN